VAYISVAVEVDPAAITQEKIEAMRARIPGLIIQVGHPLYFLLEVTSERDAANAQLLTEVTDLIWDTFGAKIVRVPRRLAVQAAGQTTWSRLSSVGTVTVPAGTGLSLAAADGSRIGFQTRLELTFAPGVTAVTNVDIVAVLGGTDGNGLEADPQTDETLPWLGSIVVQAPTAGGTDEEDVDTYRSRLGDVVSTIAKTLVRPEDFERDARNVIGVTRALTLNNYTPGPPADSDAEGHVTTAVIDADGVDPGSTVRAAVLAEHEANAVAILAPHVIAATYTVITVTFAAVAYPGRDAPTVKANGEQAVLDMLDPGRWGLPAGGDLALWLDRPVVRYRDVVAAIENADGLDYTTSVLLNGSTADVVMTGPAALPDPASTATGSVTAP
jgi:hypothetical protein